MNLYQLNFVFVENLSVNLSFTLNKNKNIEC